jgi:hypothetical protein
VDLLHKLLADVMDAWAGWDVRYRLVAVGVFALVVYLLLQSLHPLVRFLILGVLAVGLAWLLFPAEVCTLPWLSTLQALCPH